MNNLELLIPKSTPMPDTFRWATITANDPNLRIKFDGDVNPIAFAPENLTGRVWKVGDRVWCQISDRRIMIVSGRASTFEVNPSTLLLSSQGAATISAQGAATVNAQGAVTIGAGTDLNLNPGSGRVKANGNTLISGNLELTGSLTKPDPPGGQLVGSGATSVLIANDSWTRFQWWGTTVEAATGGMTSSSWNLIAPTAGWYDVSAQVRWVNNTTGRRGISLDRAATAGAAFTNRLNKIVPAPTGNTSTVDLTRKLYCNAGDHIRLWVYQDCGATLGLTASTTDHYLTAVRFA